MAKAIHFVCDKDPSGQPKNVRYEALTKTFRSGFWDISLAEAEILEGGWLYLHTAKAELSYYGGQIGMFQTAIRTDVTRQIRIDLVFRPSVKAKGQKWRGQDHPRAWTSGVVSADLLHEIAA